MQNTDLTKFDLLNFPAIVQVLNEKNQDPNASDSLGVLKGKGIIYLEQLYSILTINELNESIQNQFLLSEESKFRLIENIQTILPEENRTILATMAGMEHQFGAIINEPSLLVESNMMGLRISPLATGASLENQLILDRAVDKLNDTLNGINTITMGFCTFQALSRIRNQGGRPTCVAFAFTSANEHYYYVKENSTKTIARSYRLSEQHLYLEAKLVDDNNQCGTHLISAASVLTRIGQCENQHLPYTFTGSCEDNGELNWLTRNRAQGFQAPCIQLAPNDIDLFKATIQCQGMVVCAVSVYNSWAKSPYCNATGIISLPLDKEDSIAGHAFTIVGFENNELYPGGGFFTAKNSWGEEWAYMSPYLPGYARIPYAYIIQHCKEAFAIIYP